MATTRIRTVDFLPEIFKTPTNAQFLSATLDQLVQQPRLEKIQGYVGSKFGYGVNAKNNYVTEPSKIRDDYQLDPSVVFLKKNTSTAQDFISYPGIIDALSLEGSPTADNSRLFTSQFYSWDSFTDLDMNINFNQYYWLPYGPDVVSITNGTVSNVGEYTVVSNANTYSITVNNQYEVNPTLALLRGGTYTFLVNQDSQFWIQGEPGITGYSATNPNVQTRSILGVDNNGTNAGVVTFTVPSQTAQSYYNFPGDIQADVMSTSTFDAINGSLLSDLLAAGGIDGVTPTAGLTVIFYNGLSGETGYVSPFYGSTLYDENGGVAYNPATDYPGSDIYDYNFEGGYFTTVSATIYTIAFEQTFVNAGNLVTGTSYTIVTAGTTDFTLVGASSNSTGTTFTATGPGTGTGEVQDLSQYVVKLLPTTAIPTTQKITAKFGQTYGGLTFFRSVAGVITEIPYLSSLLDVLYYQDGTSSSKVGKIKILDGTIVEPINVLTEVLGKKTYTSPNGIVFTNGLKVEFTGGVIPSSYLNVQYYVQGVGTAIELIKVNDLVNPVNPTPYSAPQYLPWDTNKWSSKVWDAKVNSGVNNSGMNPDYLPWDTNGWDSGAWDANLYTSITPDYITIARNAANKNAWARSNRWFHKDVILATAIYNNTPESVNTYITQDNKAKRPIIEFYPNVKLFNSGILAKQPVDFMDYRTTDPMNSVVNQLIYYPDVQIYTASVATISGVTAGISTTISITTAAITGTFSIGQYISDNMKLLPENAQITGVSTTVPGITTLTVGWTIPLTILTTTDVSLVANDIPNSNYCVFDGAKIIFASAAEGTRDRIYVVRFTSLTGTSTPVITLSEDPDPVVLPQEQTFAFRGYNNQGKNFYYTGIEWIEAQEKMTVNQPPLFDILDGDGISFSDETYYPDTTFIGTTLFSYAIGSGTVDTVLGFPIKYSSVNNIGDISFDVSLNSGVFTYTSNSATVTQKINTGYVYNYSSAPSYVRQLGWQTAIAPSVQYQLYDFSYIASKPTTTYTCDVVMTPRAANSWPTIQVLVNNVVQPASAYTVTVTDTQTIVLFTVPSPLVDTIVQVMLVSTQTSKQAYYSIPVNLSNNPLNEDVVTVNVGDIRGQYQSIFYNSPDTVGKIFGSNNYRDLGNLVPWGSRIIQNSAALVLPGVFLRKQNHNLFNALMFNSKEYITYKTMLVDTVNNTDYSAYQTPAVILNQAIDKIAREKTQGNSFFWSDMLPAQTEYTTNSYSYTNSQTVSIYPLSRIYNFKSANYYGVLLYKATTLGGVVYTSQLIANVDYVISDTSPSVTVTADLLPGDVITINEYTQTYGSYVPNTPTKLGLYPATIPAVVLDRAYAIPTYFIVGHDGSYNKLYGDYNPVTDKLVDFRDQALLEFEKRIYNNLKLSASVPIQEYEVLPGFFRDTDYSYSEILEIYSTSFLNWVGQNRIDYQKQYYNANDEFTYNYDQSGNKIDRQPIEQGYWRGVYEYFYDTSSPDTAPWEMLGFTNKPTWWESRYGAAPYTSDNLVLWSDMAQGIDWNNGNPVVITHTIRPQLLTVLPVDSAGNLVSPFISLVGNYIGTTFERNWQVGDVGPAEFSYRRSSSWPFDLMRILALTKPAEFFNLGVDVDNYKYNAEFNQYLVNDRSHLVVNNIAIYGNGTPKTSYINWIVDFEKQVGVDATQNISDLLYNLDVRLVYRLAGFSGKNMLKFYAEKGNVSYSAHSSLLIPDASFALLLYDNQPSIALVYSSVIIQITAGGKYAVYGNSQTSAYFSTLAPKLSGDYDTIIIESTRVRVANEYSDTVVTVPYGTVFPTVETMSQFLMSYGQYLEAQGMVFAQLENELEVNWRQMVAEFVYWAQTGWEQGSILNINPAASSLVIDKASNVVQPLTLQQQNFILNQNLYPVQATDMSVVRNSTNFAVTPLNVGDTIAYGKFNMSSIEHAIVFDNVTQFNDLIYDPITGLRQNRISVTGRRSAEWDGTIDAQGFILNQDNIVEWNQTVKYTTGSIVTYKNKYWIATQIIQAKEIFDEKDWQETNYDDIQKGLLPNSSTRSYESSLYYDINQANLEDDADLLSFSLIGYRPRDYMSSADLTDITQINVYKNMIQNKGTLNAASAFKGTQLSQGGIQYDIYENWAIKSGEFGGLLNSNFVEFSLNETLMTGNPSTVGLTDGLLITGAEQDVALTSLLNYSRPVTSVDILPVVNADIPSLLFPDAGYANFNDVKMSSYYYAGLPVATDANGTIVPIGELYVRDYVWLANYLGTWQIFTPISLSPVTVVNNNLNNTVTVTFTEPHGLKQYQALALVNVSANVDGYYVAAAIVNPFSVIIVLNLLSTITTIVGQGLGFRFQSQRVTKSSDIISLPLLDSEFTRNTVWVDENTDGAWTVYRKTINYQYGTEVTKASSVTYGSAVAYSDLFGYLIGDSGVGAVYLYSSSDLSTPAQTITQSAGFGLAIAYAGDTVVISQNSGFAVYKWDSGSSTLVLSQTEIVGTNAIAVSGDKNWIYVSDITNCLIRSYKLDAGTYIAGQTFTVDTFALTAADNFGYSLATDYNGDKIFVGTPNQDYDPLTDNWGYTYVFARTVQNFEAQMPNTSGPYTLVWTPNLVNVYLNGIELSSSVYNISTNTLTILVRVRVGDIITVSGDNFVLVQTLTTETTPKIGVRFGFALDTTSSGNELIVGAPFELTNDLQEGSAYRYTNGGGEYGLILGDGTCSLSVDTVILLNGYQVTLPAGDATAAAAAIVSAGITNITASATAGKLIISLVNYGIADVNTKLSLTVLTTIALAEMGISLYTQTQVISCPHLSSTTQFGYSVSFNETGSVIISAPTGTRYAATTFDFTDDGLDNDTVFDNNTTQWIDGSVNAGAVYMFDYIGAYNGSLVNPGNFVYAQSVNARDEVYGKQPYYGTRLDFNNSTVVVGTPAFMPGVTNGQVITYSSVTSAQDWSVYRSSCAVVDTSRIGPIQLFSERTNETLDNLDYIDPLQGKILGAARENIDVISNVDPAGYNAGQQTKMGAMIWGASQVGHIWFDTSNVRFVNYHQNDLTYNSKYWGRVFTGSDVAVYSWVVSNTPPQLYSGPGTVYNPTTYTVENVINASNELSLVYFFWVRNTNIIFTKAGKTLADAIIQSYIASPQLSGVSYFAGLLPNVFALYNAAEYINARDTVLHIGYQTGTNDDIAHAAYDLIRDGYADDFLPGLPNTSIHDMPYSLYARLLDSLSGRDLTGDVVPNPLLPKAVQLGVLARPRQSLFFNRLLALQNYLTYANEQLALYPITELKQLQFLTVGNTALYWSYINWWSPGYNDSTKSAGRVAIYADLSTLIVPVGTVITVDANGNGIQETYVYNSLNVWERIGLTNGTIEFLATLWNSTITYDTATATATRNIVRALNEDIYTNELLILRNQSLILLFEYIQSETIETQNYLPWLNKTSFIDVAHTIRELLPLETLQSDNQEFLSGYINEVKPYRVVVKDFLFKYTGTDIYDISSITDFDLPSKYNTALEKFITPELIYSGVSTSDSQYVTTSPIWNEPEYINWKQNYGISLAGIPDYSITTLVSYMMLNSSECQVANVNGFPIVGTILIDSEYIGYSAINTTTGMLTGLTRGLYSSPIEYHFPGSEIIIDLPAVVVLNGGRKYSIAPVVTAYIDTTVYPAPTVPAILTAVMGADSVISITVVNPGEGYVVTPTIVIEPSAVLAFAASQVNIYDSSINLQTSVLITGDLVHYTTGVDTVAPAGLISDQYYYVGVLSTTPFVIAMYTNLSDAQQDEHRVVLSTTGTGEYNTLSLRALASCITNAQPIRENIITLRYDRTSYSSAITDWNASPSVYYGASYIGDAQSETSSRVKLESTQPAISTILASSQLATFEITQVSNVASSAVISIVYPGIVTVTATTAAANTLTVPVVSFGQTGTQGFFVGQPVFFTGTVYGEVIKNRVYYILDVIDTQTIKLAAAENDTSSVALTTAAGSMTMTVGDPIAPGQLNGQLVTFEKTGIISGTVSGVVSNVITCTINGADPTGSYLYIEPASTGVENIYVNMPFVLSANYAGLIAGTTYQVSGIGAITSTAINTSSGTNIIGCTSTAGFLPYMEVKFSGTAFGGLSVNKKYYVLTIIDGGNFTITDTVGSTIAVTLSTSTGSMLITGSSYVQAAGYVTSIETSTVTLTQNIPTVGYSVSYTRGGYILSTPVGSGYAVGNIITISGAVLGGTTPLNDFVLSVDTIDSLGAILSYISSSTPASAIANYYVKAITDTTLGVYYDKAMTLPVSYSVLSYYGTGDYLYLPTPVVFNASMVVYNKQVYECTVSNNDTTFVPFKWAIVQSSSRKLNALDRIMAYYAPTINMPGRDLTQLMTGLTYPNAQYMGNVGGVSSEFEIDTTLQSLPFAPTQLSITSVTWNGLQYIAVANSADYSSILTSTDGLTWVVTKLSDQAIALADISHTTDSRYVIAARNMATPILTSIDGVYWNSSPTVTVAHSDLSSVAYLNGVYVAVGTALVRSTDALTWGTIQSDFTGTFVGVAGVFVSGYVGFIAVGLITGPAAANVLQTSTDGITWLVPAGLSTTHKLNAVADSDDLIVTVGDSGTSYYSLDAVTWTANSTATAVTLNDIAYSPTLSIFMAVGNSGEIQTYDGVSWTYILSGITENLNGVTWNTTSGTFVVVGVNNTVLSISYGNLGPIITVVTDIATDTVDYTIQGDAFAYGYGPEELVPGVVSDTMTMVVTTNPGTTWPVGIYQNTGYNVVSSEVASTGQTVYSFGELVQTPAQLQVFAISGVSGLSTTLLPSEYVIDWVAKTITLNTALSTADTLRIDVYETGNGNQLVKSNTDQNPIVVNSVTGFDEIPLDCAYSDYIYAGSGVINSITNSVWTSPIVYHNGDILTLGIMISVSRTNADNTITCVDTAGMVVGDTVVFDDTMFGPDINRQQVYYVVNVTSSDAFKISLTLGGPVLVLTAANGTATAIVNDYAFTVAPNGQSAVMVLAGKYDPGVTDYLSYTVFGETALVQYGYTIPTVETFVGAGSIYTLSNYMGGNNPNNAVVEKNGVRLQNIVDYIIGSHIMTLNVAVTGADTISVMSYNTTDRQYLNTQEYTGGTVSQISGMTNSINSAIVTNVHSTTAGTNVLTCDSTTGFISGQTVIFRVGTVPGTGIGGVNVTGTVYFIGSIVSATEFTISATLGGATFTVTTDTGIMQASVGGNAAVRITTTAATNLTENALVTIDQTAGSTQLNGNTYYAKVISSTQVELYYSPYGPYIDSINYPVTATSSWTGGGYMLAAGTYVLVNTVATTTTSTDNSVTVVSTASLVVGTQLIFTGTEFGNIVANQQYYIKSIDSDNNKITLSLTYLGTEVVVTDDTGSMNVIQLSQTNVDRLWVTINGYRVPSSKLVITPTSNVSIMSAVAPTDLVIITSMVPTASPNQQVYLQQVNKQSQQVIYRADTQYTSTWLTKALLYTDSEIVVHAAADVTATVVQTVQAPAAVSGVISIGLTADKDIISNISVLNTSTFPATIVTAYTYSVVGLVPTLLFTGGVSETDILEITVLVGNMIYVDGEYIKFTTCDLTTNTLSGLQRGSLGTGIKAEISVYSRVYGLLPGNMMSPSLYDNSWNSFVYNPTIGDPLQISNTVAAEFLTNVSAK
jgi:hypothetical protein